MLTAYFIELLIPCSCGLCVTGGMMEMMKQMGKMDLGALGLKGKGFGGK